MTILVTGARGFVGGALVERLAADNASACVVAAATRLGVTFSKGVKLMQVGDLLPMTNWCTALQGVSAVVHYAARVHVMTDKRWDPLAEFRQVDVESTANRARQAAAAGVRRFVFLSSIRVNGEFTEAG